jgi:hypothetical protein
MSMRWLMVSLVPALLATCCVRFHGPEDVRTELSRQAGVRLKQETGLTVTRSGVWLARKALRWSGEEEISLRGVRRVEVGIYEVRGLRGGQAERVRLDPRYLERDWQPIVRVHDEGEDVFVLVHEREGALRGMLVVVADQDEWVLVRLRGKLDRIVEDAMRLAFDQADRPDLFERAMEQREPQADPPVRAYALADWPSYGEPWGCPPSPDWPPAWAAQCEASFSSHE